jgi:hypothetical protein
VTEDRATPAHDHDRRPDRLRELIDESTRLIRSTLD